MSDADERYLGDADQDADQDADPEADQEADPAADPAVRPGSGQAMLDAIPVLAAKIRMIESDHNTAQDYLETLYLSKLKQNTAELIVHNYFSGIIDFSSIGKSANIFNLKHIAFRTRGHITQVLNIPESVVKFECGNQLLTAISGLPPNLEVLNLGKNSISTLNLATQKKLRVLNVESNALKHLQNLPGSLEELYIDNNLIRHLDLGNLPRLRVLHCANNAMLKIENVPSSIQDLRVEAGNPRVRVEYEFDLTSPSSAAQKPLPDAEAEFIDSLNEYFRLKTKYETAVLEDRRAVRLVGEKKRVGHKEIKQRVSLVRGKCIGCARRVGTVFKLKNLRYLAYCGDHVKPCDLKIEIYRGDYINRLEMVEEYRDFSRSIKEDIIQHKMDTLFGYITEQASAAKFTKLVESYHSSNIELKQGMEDYNEQMYSQRRREIVRVKLQKLAELRRMLTDNLAEYAGKKSEQALTDITRAYIDEYLPEMNNLRMLRHRTMEIDQTYVDPRNHPATKLFQSPMDFSQLDYLMGEPPRVLQSRGIA